MKKQVLSNDPYYNMFYCLEDDYSSREPTNSYIMCMDRRALDPEFYPGRQRELLEKFLTFAINLAIEESDGIINDEQELIEFICDKYDYTEFQIYTDITTLSLYNEVNEELKNNKKIFYINSSAKQSTVSQLIEMINESGIARIFTII